jgi:hypothetical protein
VSALSDAVAIATRRIRVAVLVSGLLLFVKSIRLSGDLGGAYDAQRN